MWRRVCSIAWHIPFKETRYCGTTPSPFLKNRRHLRLSLDYITGFVQILWSKIQDFFHTFSTQRRNKAFFRGALETYGWIFTIFSDLCSIFQTFSRSGKLLGIFQDFFKNSRLGTNPDVSVHCRRFLRAMEYFCISVKNCAMLKPPYWIQIKAKEVSSNLPL